LCCTLVPRTPASYPPTGSTHPIYAVRSARVFDSGFLSAPFTGIQLPSSTLRRYLTGAGLARLIRANFSANLSYELTACLELVRSRERTRKQPGLPGTQPTLPGDSLKAPPEE
jgi:hypothetical protein